MTEMNSPYRKAATLLQGNTECFFIAAIAQILNPGNPILYAYGPSVTDMCSGNNLYYTPD